MNYSDSEKYLKSLGNEVLAMKLGLENIATLLDELGDPQKTYPKVQVAGTNGKGSTCAFLEAICLAAGIKVGVNVSPHLIRFTERIRINGRDIKKKDFARIAKKVRKTSEKLVKKKKLPNLPTFFEQVTAAALLAFEEAGVELVILETGLGGRLDATTAAKAEYAGITRIDLDHQKQLGHSIKKIAGEKAAIIGKQTESVVVGEQRPEAMRVIKKACKEREKKPILAEKIDLPPVELSLKGKHQFENARTAVGLARSLRPRFEISEEHIAKGLETAKHPGRIEFIGNFLLDGAHNAAGATALVDYVRDNVKEPITLVFGAMRDKSVEKIAGLLFPLAEKIVLTRPANKRAVKPQKLLKMLPENLAAESSQVTETTSEAIDAARRVTPENGLILITGSLYLVGEVRRVLIEAEKAASKSREALAASV